MPNIYGITQRHGICIHQYVDDTQLYVAFNMNEQNDTISRMKGCLNGIRIWMRNNKLKLNEDKTELLNIAPAKQAHKITINSIRICDCMVIGSKSAKNLGATLD